ncbi:hypothetical protein ACFLQ2_05180 [archaeon]
MNKRRVKPGKKAPETYSFAENGLLTPKRYKKLDNFLKFWNNRRPVRWVHGFAIKRHHAEERLDKEGKHVQARLSGLASGVATHIFPPPMDAKRFALMLLGGKKGWAEAHDIKEKQREPTPQMLKNIKAELDYIKKKNEWHFEGEDIRTVRKIKNRIARRRAKAKWMMGHQVYWGSLLVGAVLPTTGLAEVATQSGRIIAQEALVGAGEVALETALEEGSVRLTEAGVKELTDAERMEHKSTLETKYLEHRVGVALGYIPSLKSRIKNFPSWFRRQQIGSGLSSGELTPIHPDTKEKRGDGFVFYYNHEKDPPTVSVYSLQNKGHNYKVLGKDVRVKGMRVKIRFGPEGGLHAEGSSEVTKTFTLKHGTVDYLPPEAEKDLDKYVLRQVGFAETNKKEKQKLADKIMNKLGKHLMVSKRSR